MVHKETKYFPLVTKTYSSFELFILSYTNSSRRGGFIREYFLNIIAGDNLIIVLPVSKSKLYHFKKL